MPSHSILFGFFFFLDSFCFRFLLLFLDKRKTTGKPRGIERERECVRGKSRKCVRKREETKNVRTILHFAASVQPWLYLQYTQTQILFRYLPFSYGAYEQTHWSSTKIFSSSSQRIKYIFVCIFFLSSLLFHLPWNRITHARTVNRRKWSSVEQSNE